MNTYVGSFALNTSTGNQAVTGVGFTPSFILFFISSNTADGTINNVLSGVGVGVSSSLRASIGNADSNNVSPTVASARIDNTKCITIINPAQTIINDADLVSMDADGFTINVTTTDGTARILNYIAYGGSDITNVTVKEFTSKTSTGSQGVTGVGFKPDCILLLGDLSSTVPPANRGAGFLHYGFGVSSSARAVLANNLGNNVSFSVEEKTQETNKIIHITNGGSTFFSADLTSLDSDGFTLNWTTANGTARYIEALCIKGGNFAVGAFNQPTSTGNNAVTGVGFVPTGLLLLSFNNVSTTALVNDVSSSFGFASGTSNQGTLWYGAQHNVNPSNSHTALKRTKTIDLIDSATQTVNAEASLNSFDSDGFTLNWSTADATARQVIYLAIGSPPVSTAYPSQRMMMGMGT